MPTRTRSKLVTLTLGAFLLVLSISCWFHPTQEFSNSERRKLATFPTFSLEEILSGNFMTQFTSYSQDQFPLRDTFRRVKSMGQFYLLQQKDSHDIYLYKGQAAALLYPLNASSISFATERFQYLYDTYLAPNDMTIYASVIPDKGYYIAEEGGYLSLDYQELFRLTQAGMPYAQFISITEELSAQDYYRTDSHWMQPRLEKVAKKLSAAMSGASAQSVTYEEKEASLEPFYGVYYGQAALPMEPDTISYLTNEMLESAIMYNYETDETTGIYNWDKLGSRDPYEFFLSGAAPLLTIQNPGATSQKQLIIFRDSYGSSLAPLLIQDYATVVLIDIRYITSPLLSEFLDFGTMKGADVLFLYSASLLNSSSSLR